jgi:dUTP pyrophosphatase
MNGTDIFKVVKLHPDAKIPKRQTEGSAGCDLCSNESGVINPRELKVIRTGIAISVPKGYVGMIYGRSGLAVKYSLGILGNNVHHNDHGEISVVIYNNGMAPFLYEKGERIAQVVFVCVSSESLINVETLDGTTRGSDGFGSTGND